MKQNICKPHPHNIKHLKFTFNAISILWKSDSPVVIVDVFWKLLGEFVIKRSTQLGLSLLLKHVFSEIIFFASYSNKNCDKHGSVSSALNSSIRRN